MYANVFCIQVCDGFFVVPSKIHCVVVSTQKNVIETARIAQKYCILLYRLLGFTDSFSARLLMDRRPVWTETKKFDLDSFYSISLPGGKFLSSVPGLVLSQLN